MNKKSSKYVFVLLPLLSIAILAILSFPFYKIDSKIPFFLILIALCFLIVQTFRILKSDLYYKGWSNCEMIPTLIISVCLLSMPNLLYFIVFKRIHIVLIPFVLNILFIIFASVNLIVYMNGFSISKSRTFLSSIVDILDRKGIKNRVQHKVRKYDLGFSNKVKVILLQYFDCILIEKGNKIIIKPSNREAKNNVYNLIDLIEKEDL